MKIKWLGHSSFLLTESTGITLITDPFDKKMVGYSMSGHAADIVCMSHGHADHNYIEGVKNYKQAFRDAGTFEYEGRVHITGVQSYHDDNDGKERGENIIYKIGMDGVNICHMGDIGEPCSPELIERLLPVDVLMIPVGGNYTIDAELAKEYVDRLMPSIVIPMHYKIKHCEIDIDKVDPFLRLFDDEEIQEDIDELELDRYDFDENLPTKVLVLNKK